MRERSANRHPYRLAAHHIGTWRLVGEAGLARGRSAWFTSGNQTRTSCSHSPTFAHMCGRYASYLPPEFIARLFGTVNRPPHPKPTWNMAPTQDALVVRWDLESKERHLDVLRWGLAPYFTKDLKTARKPINARSESVATSGMFKAAFGHRRCLVPAAAYYEWRDDPRRESAIRRWPPGR
jgi:hypothetical protein